MREKAESPAPAAVAREMDEDEEELLTTGLHGGEAGGGAREQEDKKKKGEEGANVPTNGDTLGGVLTNMAARVWSAGPLMMILSALSFSLMDVCAKAAERRLPALQCVAARLAFMLPFNTAVLHWLELDWRGHADTRWLLLQRGVCGFFAFSCLLQVPPHSTSRACLLIVYPCTFTSW